MKKKIIILIIVLLIILGIYTSYIDSARVRNGIEPKFTIKLISDGGNKVTYWGLGYKVIRYTSVSPSEPYKNSRGVKYGSWFMKHDIDDIDNNKEISKIEDTTKEIKDFACAEALEEFYEDDKYEYFYSCIKSSYVLVEYKDGSTETVANALKSGKIHISDLDKYDIDYIKYEK